MKNRLIRGVIATSLIALPLSSSLLHAEEVAAGTVLNATTIDQLLDKTLDGHRIADLLPTSQERLIREFGFEMPSSPPGNSSTVTLR